MDSSKNENKNFASELVNQILISLKRKLAQLNQRRNFLEEVISNETDLDEVDLIRAQAKLEEVIDTIVFEQKFEKHFSDVSKDILIYQQTVSEKVRLEKEETSKVSLKLGLEYLNFLNTFFDHKKNAEEQLKLIEMSTDDHLNLKSFNHLLQSERKQAFDINIDILSSLVSGCDEKIKNLNCTYLEIKILLDAMIDRFKSDFFLKSTFSSAHSLVSKSIQSGCSFPTENTELFECTSEANESIVNFSNKENNFTHIKKFKLDNNEIHENENIINDIEVEPGPEVFHNETNLTKLGNDMSKNPSINRLDYAYTLTKIIFNRDERVSGYFSDSFGKSPRHNSNRVAFDSERIQLLKDALQSTKFRFSFDIQKAEEEWQLVRSGLNKKLSKNFKKKKSNITNETCHNV